MTTTVTEQATCVIGDVGCQAPPWEDGRLTRARCTRCGLAVCDACSARRTVRGDRGRVCVDCWDDYQFARRVERGDR